MRKGLTFIGSLAAAAAMIATMGPLVESRPVHYPKRRGKKLPALQVKTNERVNKAPDWPYAPGTFGGIEDADQE